MATAMITRYLSHARTYLALHGKATSKQLDEYIMQQGLIVKPCSSISALNRLASNGEAKKEVVDAKYRYNLFIALPALGHSAFTRPKKVEADLATPEGVLMLQDIFMKPAATVRLWDEA
ncbi:MAG: hypothetical protein HOP06_11910 [Methylotenera sp.]|nr:hypothetical protein [Methylotenera sp.]